ncbi:MAG TPA: DUF1080 domain-containing protein [Lacipirellulaceae bacterium]|nr:DUF1080 domain-containing protein [Lacipirellulaceae bacterium]
MKDCFQKLVDIRSCGVALVVVLLAFSILDSSALSNNETSGEGEALFAEEGVPSGWSVRQWNDISKPAGSKDSWVVREGVLHGGEPRGTWLVSEREYGNFELEFEFKLGALGNSGLALRAPLKGDPAFDGMELQMADFRYNPDAKDSELTGGIYRAIAPQKQVYKPEEWNRYEITLDGSKLRASLNGELIHDIDLSQQEQIVKRHDGSDAPPVKDRPTRGHIGFQNLSRGGEDVLIRNVRIKVLD